MCVSLRICVGMKRRFIGYDIVLPALGEGYSVRLHEACTMRWRRWASGYIVSHG
jgi:hypothetical protein